MSKDQMALPRPEELLAIAHIVRPHGVHGELSVIPLAPPVLEAIDLIVERRLYARDPAGGLRPVHGVSVRGHQDRWLVVLEESQTMDEAEAFRGIDLCLPRAELPELPEGWYWEADLQLCEVFDRTLGQIGTVKGLRVTGAQAQLELSRPDGSLALIPWVRAFILEVNIASRQIHTDLPLDFPGISSSPTGL